MDIINSSAWKIQALEDQCIIAMIDIIAKSESGYLAENEKVSAKLGKIRDLEVGALDELNKRLAAISTDTPLAAFEAVHENDALFRELEFILMTVESMARGRLGRDLNSNEKLCLKFDLLREVIAKSNTSALHQGLIGKTSVAKYIAEALNITDGVRHDMLPNVKPVMNVREVKDVVVHFKDVLRSKFFK